MDLLDLGRRGQVEQVGADHLVEVPAALAGESLVTVEDGAVGPPARDHLALQIEDLQRSGTEIARGQAGHTRQGRPRIAAAETSPEDRRRPRAPPAAAGSWPDRVVPTSRAGYRSPAIRAHTRQLGHGRTGQQRLGRLANQCCRVSNPRGLRSWCSRLVAACDAAQGAAACCRSSAAAGAPIASRRHSQHAHCVRDRLPRKITISLGRTANADTRLTRRSDAQSGNSDARAGPRPGRPGR